MTNIATSPEPAEAQTTPAEQCLSAALALKTALPPSLSGKYYETSEFAKAYLGGGCRDVLTSMLIVTAEDSDQLEPEDQEVFVANPNLKAAVVVGLQSLDDPEPALVTLHFVDTPNGIDLYRANPGNPISYSRLKSHKAGGVDPGVAAGFVGDCSKIRNQAINSLWN